MSNESKTRSILAVFAGVLTNIIVAVPIDALLHAVHVFPPPEQRLSNSLCALAFSYRFVAAILGGAVTARLAPQRPLKHALILGCVGVVMSTAGTIAMWDVGPNWYPVMLIVISVPCSWLGARWMQFVAKEGPMGS